MCVQRFEMLPVFLSVRFCSQIQYNLQRSISASGVVPLTCTASLPGVKAVNVLSRHLNVVCPPKRVCSQLQYNLEGIFSVSDQPTVGSPDPAPHSALIATQI